MELNRFYLYEPIPSSKIFLLQQTTNIETIVSI